MNYGVERFPYAVGNDRMQTHIGADTYIEPAIPTVSLNSLKSIQLAGSI